MHWEWKIFLRMQRFWTLEAICVAWSKLPARWCAKESSNLSRYTTQAMQPCRQSLLGHGLSPHKLRHATSQAEPARSRAVASQAAPCNLAGRACSVTGCHVILYKPCNLAGKACSVTGCHVILYKPCNLAGKACSVTGCRPIKRQSPTASYVSELPTKQREFVFLHGL